MPIPATTSFPRARKWICARNSMHDIYCFVLIHSARGNEALITLFQISNPHAKVPFLILRLTAMQTANGNFKNVMLKVSTANVEDKVCMHSRTTT